MIRRATQGENISARALVRVEGMNDECKKESSEEEGHECDGERRARERRKNGTCSLRNGVDR